MATINSSTTRGRVSSITTTVGQSFNGYLNVRDSSNGTSSSVNINDSSAVRASASSSGGGWTYTCSRYFMAFNTSSITSTPGSATLNIYGNTNITSNFIVVKSTSPTTSTNINIINFSSISGYLPFESMAGNVTEYSSPTTFSTSTGWNTIELNSSALNDMNSLTTFQIAIVNYTYDYSYFDPDTTFDVRLGINVTNQPYIQYTAYNGQIYSIPLNTISKVDDIPTDIIKNIIN
jgi:hypothetical protein